MEDILNKTVFGCNGTSASFKDSAHPNTPKGNQSGTVHASNLLPWPTRWVPSAFTTAVFESRTSLGKLCRIKLLNFLTNTGLWSVDT